ncbi:MAG: YdeI/OmpD-associated family protein [Anaerolineae bacterium]|jgi:hypothetical protein|nr:YdeI/OmpD-associated family protein [Anaerolineae bacterium]
MSTEQTFEALVQKEGKFTFVALPFLPRDVWGRMPRFAVTGTINGIPVRGTLGAEGQEYFLRLGAAWLRDSGVAVGEMVTVTLALEGPQVDSIADDIAAALLASPNAKSFFESLPTFYRKNYMRWIESAKREDTRKKRIAEMIALLEDGKREK